MEFKNKVVIVTGASSGIGKATALAMIHKEANVLLVSRSKSALSKLKENYKCEYIAIDITAKDAAKAIVAKAIDIWGKIDILVNAAGILNTGSIETTKLEDFEYMINLNLTSVFKLVQASLPHLKKSQGNVVNVSSVTGLRAFPNILAYCVSKAALDQLTRCSALELAESGVRVNAVNPGVVMTELHKRGGMDNASYEEFLVHSKTTHPLGRVGTPDEIAELILFLASEKTTWITGETISIDGGRFLTCAR